MVSKHLGMGLEFRKISWFGKGKWKSMLPEAIIILLSRLNFIVYNEQKALLLNHHFLQMYSVRFSIFVTLFLFLQHPKFLLGLAPFNHFHLCKELHSFKSHV